MKEKYKTNLVPSELPLTISVCSKTTTVVGALRKNKPEIPPEFLKPKLSTPNIFAFTQDVVLVSHTLRKIKLLCYYQPCRNEVVS
nr:unnamed protein product [Callosobruchus analis]